MTAITVGRHRHKEVVAMIRHLMVTVAVAALVAVAAGFCWAGEESANWPTQSMPEGAAVAPVFNAGTPGAPGRDGRDVSDDASGVVTKTICIKGRPVVVYRSVPAEGCSYESQSAEARQMQWDCISAQKRRLEEETAGRKAADAGLQSQIDELRKQLEDLGDQGVVVALIVVLVSLGVVALAAILRR